MRGAMKLKIVLILAHITANVKTLGEGGYFNHKRQCGEQMLNIAVNVGRSTAPPLLPNVSYAFGFFET